eukprot:11216290-Lingulodinium_polyedra.AAC.1
MAHPDLVARSTTKHEGPGIESWALHTLRCMDAPSSLGKLRATVRNDDPETPTAWGAGPLARC